MSGEDELWLRIFPLLQGWGLPQVGSLVSNSGFAFLGGVIALGLRLLFLGPFFSWNLREFDRAVSWSDLGEGGHPLAELLGRGMT